MTDAPFYVIRSNPQDIRARRRRIVLTFLRRFLIGSLLLGVILVLAVALRAQVPSPARNDDAAAVEKDKVPLPTLNKKVTDAQALKVRAAQVRAYEARDRYNQVAERLRLDAEEARRVLNATVDEVFKSVGVTRETHDLDLEKMEFVPRPEAKK